MGVASRFQQFPQNVLSHTPIWQRYHGRVPRNHGVDGDIIARPFVLKQPSRILLALCRRLCFAEKFHARVSGGRMAVVNSVCQDDRTCQLDHRHVYNRHCPPRCLSNRTRYDSDTHALSDERANRCIGLSAIHGEGGVPSVNHVSTLKCHGVAGVISGSANQKVVPWPSVLCRPTWPLCCSMIERLIYKPKPRPTLVPLSTWVPSTR